MRASLRSDWLRRLLSLVARAGGGSFHEPRREACRSSLTSSFSRSAAQVKRMIEALEMLGQPLQRGDKARLEQALDSTGGEPAIRTIQNVLDNHCLIGIEINAESRVKSSQGPAQASSGPEWVVGLPRQGPQRGWCHGRARRREPQRRPGVPAVDRPRRAEGVDSPRRCRSALGRCDHVQ